MSTSSLPSAPYLPACSKSLPTRRTATEMRRALPAGAAGFTMFRTNSGRPANAFCEYRAADGARVARYHETDILRLHPDGSLTITFGGWHTMATRERFNIAAKAFGLAVRARACGKVGVTAFSGTPIAPAPRLDDRDGAPSGYATIRINPEPTA